MKLSVLRNITLAFVAVATITSCNPLNKMEKNVDSTTYEATPNPLEMHGDSVKVTISGKIPTEYLHKKAAVKVVPFFEANGQEVVSLNPFVLVGEDSDFQGQKISFDAGGSFTYDYTYAYDDKMERGVLKAKLIGMYKTKEQEIGMFEVAQGTNITPRWVQSDEMPILGKDNFQRVVPMNQNAEVLFDLQSASVKSAELKDSDIVAMMDAIKNNSKDTSIVFKGLEINAYASPDGELTLNENLADDRAKNAGSSIKSQLSKNKVNTSAEGFFTMKGNGEDWAGFKQKMQASDIQDKQLIIRVLEMYEDPAKREAEIKNLAETYLEVKEKILPPLRRSQITLKMDKVGRSDEQITALAQNDPAQLSVEEILYAATLTDDLSEKLKIYTKASELYSTDWRTFNNIGYVNLVQNKLGEAESNFNKAKDLKADPVVMNNLGVIASLKGDRSAARDLYSQANGAGKEVNYNLGILDIKEGDYSSAVSNMNSYKTFNLALAQVLNGDNEGALQTIDASEDASSAEAYYLKAIIGARTSNQELMMKNLQSAINKDASLKEKAGKDVEFIKADLSQL
jgi:tetratricopeptide (TPR) repeat protein